MGACSRGGGGGSRGAPAPGSRGLHRHLLPTGPIEDYPQLDNPYGIDSPLLDPLTGLAVLLLLIGIVGSAASVIARFRRARGELRQQIKWLALAGTVAAVVVVVATAGSDVLWGAPRPTSRACSA